MHTRALPVIREKSSWLSELLWWGVFLVLGYHELALCQKLLSLFAYIQHAVQSSC